MMAEGQRLQQSRLACVWPSCQVKFVAFLALTRAESCTLDVVGTCQESLIDVRHIWMCGCDNW